LNREVADTTIERLIRRLRWIVVIASVLALVGGCGGEDEAAPPMTTETEATSEAATTTSQTTTQADPNSPVELELLALPPPELRPGLVKTSGNFEPTVVFRAPEGWNGTQDSEGFGIGKGVNVEAEEFDRASIYVWLADLPLAKAAAKFETLPELTIVSEEPSRVGGYPGRTYEIVVFGEHVILEPLGIPGADIPRGKHQPTLLSVRGQTLLITLSGVTDLDRAEAEQVLRSFRFPH
jgi:hypothetical protein